MKINAGFRVESEVMQSLARSGYCTNLLREKEASFREKNMNREIDNPSQLFSESIRKHYEPEKTPQIKGTAAPEGIFNPSSTVQPMMLVRMEEMVRARYPMPEKVPLTESAFWRWAQKQRESMPELQR